VNVPEQDEPAIGQQNCREPLQYRDSSPEYVYLLNGYCWDRERGRNEIEKRELLHEAIARSIISQNRRLDPEQFRFLRIQLRRSLAAVARSMGLTPQSIARYEKGTTGIPGPSDLLIRILYIISRLGQEEWLRWLDRLPLSLGDARPGPPARAYFKLMDSGWQQVE
jgi:DNA-binding transcriptional regulator YiaG